MRYSTRCSSVPAMLTTLAGLIVVLTMVVTEISDLFRMVKSVFGL